MHWEHRNESLAGRFCRIFCLAPALLFRTICSPPVETASIVNTFRIGFITLDASGITDPNTPLKNLKVREAINLAIDKEGIARSLIGDLAKPIASACKPGQFGCTQDVKTYRYDPQAAKALMAEAGYANGFDIDVYGYRSRPVAEAIVGNLAAIGIRASLRWQQYTSVIKDRREHNAAMVIDDYGSSGVNDVSGIGLQKISGDNAWFRLSDACPCGIVANDSLTNASTNAKEKSWQVRYDYNFAAMGMPGLTMMTRYIRGTNVKTATTDNGSEWSHDEGIDYVFQSGTAKNLSVGLRNGTIHKSFNPSFNETRVIINYPISLL